MHKLARTHLKTVAAQIRALINILTTQEGDDPHTRDLRRRMFLYQSGERPVSVLDGLREEIEGRWGDYGHGNLFVPVTLESVGEGHARTRQDYRYVLDHVRSLWLRQVANFMEFVAVHGKYPSKRSPNVEEERLAMWWRAQCLKQDKGEMSVERRRVMEIVVPDWEARRFSRFGRKAREVEKFLAEHDRFPRRIGTPLKGESVLVRWLEDQVSAYRKGEMLPEHVELLDRLAPGWNTRDFEAEKRAFMNEVHPDPWEV